MEAISVINLMPSNQDEIESFVVRVKESILNNQEPFHAALQLSAMEKVLKALRADKDIRELIVDELTKYDQGKSEILGAKIETCETGAKYDYQDDHILSDLSDEKSQIDKRIKERQTMLKSLKESMYDGDGIECKPAIKSSTTNYKITIK